MAQGRCRSDAAAGRRKTVSKAMLGTHTNRDFGPLARLTVPATDRRLVSALGLVASVVACVLAVLLVRAACAAAAITLYPVANEAVPISLVAAGDGNLWFTTERTGQVYPGIPPSGSVIGEITPSGVVSLRPFAFPFLNPSFRGVRSDGKPLLSGDDGRSGNLSVFDPATVTYEELLQIPDGENSFITGVTTDQYGATWYDREDQIDRLSFEGPSYPVPFGEIQPFYYEGLEGLAMSSDGTFWAMASNGVVSMTRDGVFTLYPTGCITTQAPVAAAGRIWLACPYTSSAAGPAIESLDPATKQVTTYDIPSFGGLGFPRSLVLGPDGAIWFSMIWVTEPVEGTQEVFTNIARIASNGALCYVGLPDPEPTPLTGSSIETVAVGPGSENALWFSMSGATSVTSIYTWIGQLTTDTPCSPAPITPPAPTPSSPPPPPPPFSTTVQPIVLPKVESLQIRRVKQGFGVLGFGISYGTYTELLVALAVPEFDVELFASELAVETVTDQVAADPPRQDYYRLARGWASAAKRPRQNANAWNRLAANQLREATLGRALLVSIERLDGAAAAGQCPAVQDQDREIAAVASALRDAFVTDTKLRGALRKRLSGQYGTWVVTARQFANAQRRVRRSGLPKTIIAALHSAGLSPTEIASFTQSFIKAPPKQERFLGALSSQPLKSVIDSLGGLSVAARRSAGACQTSPGT
jgi:hypothetical protein